MPTLRVEPTNPPPSTVVTVTGTSFKNAKTRLMLDGIGATTNIFRPDRNGWFQVGITVGSVVKTQLLVAQQQSGSTWSEVARLNITVVGTTPIPEPTTTRYVSPSGSDTTGDGSIGKPWKTLNKASDSSPAGATIYLRAGTYGPAYLNDDNRIIRGYSGEKAIISGLGTSTSRVLDVQGDDIVISDITVQDAPNQWGAGIYVSNANNVKIDNVTLKNNRSFGVKVKNATNVKLSRLDVYGNETGVEGSGTITGFELVDSLIHDHQSMVSDVNNSARGANATNFYMTTGPALIARNKIWNNRAKSVIYGYDGGAFEIYGANGLTYDSNIIWDCQNIVEMGTSGPANTNIVFKNNVAYKPSTSTAAVPGPMGGIMVRATHNGQFINNRLYGMDSWSFLVVTSNFTAGVINQGVQFYGNQVETKSRAISVDNWTGISVHDNTYYLLSGGSVGYNYGSTETVVSGSNPTRP